MIVGNERTDSAVIKGEFYTDGRTFVLRLEGTPITGSGDTATAAFEDLMKVEARTAPLAELIRQSARDQQGELVRATLIRSIATGLIVFAVFAGGLVATAAMVPHVAADVGSQTLSHLAHSVETMSPEEQVRFTGVARKINVLLGREVCASNPNGRQP